MRERDIEREQLASITAQHEAATKLANELKLLLSQVQIDSEEHVHDLEEKLKKLSKDKSDVDHLLDTKTKEIEDLNFQIEEQNLSREEGESLKSLEPPLTKIEINQKELTEKIDHFEKLEASLRTSLKEKEQEISLLRSFKEVNFEKVKEIESLRVEVNSLKFLKESGAGTEFLKSEMETLKALLANKERDYADISQQAEEFLNDIEAARKDINDRNNELRILKTKIEVLENENQIILDQSKKAEVLKNKIVENEKQLAEVAKDDEIFKMQNQILELEANKAALDSKFLKLNELENLETRNAELNEDLASKSSLIRENNAEVNALKEMLQSQQREIEVLKNSVSNSENILKENEMLIASKDQDKSKLKEELTTLNQRLNEKIKESEIFKENIKEKESSLLQLTSEIHDKEDKFNSKVNEITVLENKSEQIFKDNSLLEIEHAKEMSRKNELQVELEDVKNLNLDIQLKFENELNRNSELNIQLETLNSSNLENIGNLENQIRLNSEMQNQLEILKNIKTEYETEIEKMTATQTELKREVKNKSKEAIETGLKVENYKQELEDLKQSKIKIEEQLKFARSSTMNSNEQASELHNALTDLNVKFDNSVKAERDTASELGLVKSNFSVMEKSLNDQIECLKSEIKVMTFKFSEEKELLISEKDTIEKIKNNLTSQIQISLKENGKNLAEIQDKLLEKDRLCIELQSEIKILMENIENKDKEVIKLEETKTNLSTQLNNIKKENDVLETSINESDNKNSDEIIFLNEKCKILDFEKSEILNQNNFFKAEVEKLKENEHLLELKIDELNAQLKDNYFETKTCNEKILKYEINASNLEKSMEKAEEDVKNLEKNLSVIKADNDCLIQSKLELENNISDLEKMKTQNIMLVEKLTMEKSELNVSLESLKRQNTEINEEKSQLNKEKADLLTQVTSFEDTKKQNEILTQEKNRQIDKLKDSMKETSDELLKTELIVNELKTKNDEYIKEREKLNEKMFELNQKLETFEQFKSETELLKNENVNLRNNETELEEMRVKVDSLKTLEKSNEALKNEIYLLKAEISENQKEQETVKELERKLNETKTEAASEKREINSELEKNKKELEMKIIDLKADKMELVNELISVQEKYEKLSHKYKEQQHSREREDSSAELKLKILGLENEKRSRDAELKDLREKLTMYNLDEGGKDKAYNDLKVERDQFSSQVDFLNTIIVDLQNKKVDLEEKLVRLESRSNLPDDQKSANIRGFREASALLPLRMYCDICEKFDLHETEECPMQSMEEATPPKSRGSERPILRLYCDLCERFDMHETEDCPMSDATESSALSKSQRKNKIAAPRPYCEPCEMFGHERGECPDETF